MNIFNKLREPVFLKDSSQATLQLEKLKELESKLNDEGKKRIREDIKMLEYGIIGENQIAFELKNSHFPMYILHDLYLESEELSAQIDYLVFTRKLCFVIESKNLFGNIEINSKGDFIRTMEFGAMKKKEGLYSPITQNQRHLELMKKIALDNCNGFLKKTMIEKWYEGGFNTVVVLANPKTILYDKYAKKDVKNKVIRVDQLVSYIKQADRESKEASRSDSQLIEWAKRYLELHVEIDHDYYQKYDKFLIAEVPDKDNNKCEVKIDVENQNNRAIRKDNQHKESYDEEVDNERNKENKTEASIKKEPLLKVEQTPLFKDLRSFRWKRSKEEMIKPYFIYNDNQLKDLIEKMPQDDESLKKVNGFGDVKVSKYGQDIISIVKKYV